MYHYKTRIEDREAVILGECNGAHVLHLGCVDAPYLKERLQAKKLLHLKIRAVACRTIGIDIDEEGIAYLRESLGISDLFVVDVEQLSERKEEYGVIDTIVVGEILEHLGNPLKALQEIGQVVGQEGKLIVTVPNALALRVHYHAWFNREEVHTDHVAYYSPKTLATLLMKGGFQVERLIPYSVESTTPIIAFMKKIAMAVMSRISPFMADGIIAIARKRTIH